MAAFRWVGLRRSSCTLALVLHWGYCGTQRRQISSNNLCSWVRRTKMMFTDSQGPLKRRSCACQVAYVLQHVAQVVDAAAPSVEASRDPSKAFLAPRRANTRTLSQANRAPRGPQLA